MEQPILTRRCPRCKQDKLLETEYYKCRKNKLGYQGVCKKCVSEYNKSPIGRIVRRAYAKKHAATEKGKATRSAYLKTLPAILARRKYNKEYFNREEVKKPRREYARVRARRYRTKEQALKRRARAALEIAVRSGRIKRPSECSRCGKACNPQGHHHISYEPEHWLDVTWCCRDCHTLEHYPLPAVVSSPDINLRNKDTPNK